MSDDNQLYKKLLESIQEANDKQTKEIKSHIDKEIEILKTTIQEETQKRVKIETQYEELKQKYRELEKDLRKNNIIIFGLHNETQKPLAEFTIDTLNNLLNVNLSTHDLNNIFTIGKQNQNKPIIVKFVSYLKKVEILKAAPKLKGTNISINEELSIEDRKRNKILTQHLKEARSKGLTAYIKRNKLYVNNEEFTAEQLANNEEDAQTGNDDIEETKKEVDVQETVKVNSAPPTPTHSNKRSYNTANENVIEEIPDPLFKKKKVVLGQQRSSPRLYDMENKRK